MADTPQEQNNDGNNQEFRKYYILFAFAVIAFNMLIVCLLFCVVFFMPWKEITFKLQDPGVDAKMRVILENSEENVGNKLNTQILEELSTKLNNVEESIHKEVKSEVAKLEQQLNFQKGCNDDEDTRIYYDDDLKKQMVALENLVTSQVTYMQEMMNIEIRKNKDNLMQKLTEIKDIAHPFEELKLKVAKIESERLQSFCESDKGNCIVHTDDLENVVNELEKHMESKIQTKIDELQKLLRMNYNDKDQMTISEIEKNKEEIMKKLIEQSSVNYEIEQKLDEFGVRLNNVQALVSQNRKVSIILHVKYIRSVYISILTLILEALTSHL